MILVGHFRGLIAVPFDMDDSGGTRRGETGYASAGAEVFKQGHCPSDQWDVSLVEVGHRPLSTGRNGFGLAYLVPFTVRDLVQVTHYGPRH